MLKEFLFRISEGRPTSAYVVEGGRKY